MDGTLAIAPENLTTSRCVGRVLSAIATAILALWGLARGHDSCAQGQDTSAQNLQSADEEDFPNQKFADSFALINRSTDELGMDSPNPVDLVRAVNHLHALGKDRAIETLRAYVRHAPPESESHKRNGASQARLCCIIPLLFVAKDQNSEAPSPGDRRELAGGKAQPEPYITVEGDLPFHNVSFGGRTGPTRPGQSPLVEWAAKHGRLRAKPLRPIDDPLNAADELCEKLATDESEVTSGYSLNLTMHIRDQARLCIEHLFPNETRKKLDTWMFDDKWQKVKAAAAKLEIRWSETEQKYTAK
ncbi:MAG TPA: hypothetical protein VGM05_18235 [Planctomycetaceae bacterium]|jgi:hypothetical protein